MFILSLSSLLAKHQATVPNAQCTQLTHGRQSLSSAGRSKAMIGWKWKEKIWIYTGYP